MTYDKDRLSQLDATKLMDVVKNYRQYGLDDSTRNLAIAILEERGVTIEDLRAGGNYENHTYTQLDELYRSYGKNSVIALVLYIAVLASVISNATIPVFKQLGGVILTLVLIVAYYVYMFKAYRNTYDFYDMIGKNKGATGAMLYMLAGSSIYVITYFAHRKDMKEAMSTIQ